MEKKYIIHESLLKSIISYLASRPYAEVAEGVIALQNLEEYSNKLNIED